MAITQVFNDTFTDADGTLLTAHTPEQGLGWSPIIGNGGTSARIQGGTLVQPFYSSNEASYYTADTAEPPTLAQEVVFTFSAAAGRTSRIALRLRDGSSSADCVLIEFSTSLNIVKIYSVVEGVLTEISSAGAGGLIVDNVQCKVAIDASNNVSGDIGGTPLAFNPSPVVTGHNVAGKLGWRGVKSYTDNGISSFTGFYDVSGGGGQVPQGTATITNITPGEATAGVEFTYSDADATEYDLYIDGVYESTTASSPATATGLTAETTYTATIVPVNATGDGTASAGVQFTTNAAAAQVPQGTVTIGSITVGETTATVPYTYSAADQTGFEYRLDGGASVADAASPVELTGLTANTAYTIEVRAVNATGAGAWSTAANFTTAAASADPVIVFSATTALAFNYAPGGGDIGLRPNLTGLSVDIYDVTTRALVLSVTNHTTDANAVLASIQNAALSAATEYRIVVLGPDGSEAVFRETSQ